MIYQMIFTHMYPKINVVINVTTIFCNKANCQNTKNVAFLYYRKAFIWATWLAYMDVA